MTSEWRPAGWDNPYKRINEACKKYYGGHPFDAVEETAYEAGASAMLEALRKEPSSKTVHFDKYAKMNHFRDGIVVFIPDDAARDIPV